MRIKVHLSNGTKGIFFPISHDKLKKQELFEHYNEAICHSNLFLLSNRVTQSYPLLIGPREENKVFFNNVIAHI